MTDGRMDGKEILQRCEDAYKKNANDNERQMRLDLKRGESKEQSKAEQM